MILAVDLFAGAGGCSTGLLAAATERGGRVDLVAVNHWPIAVETHTRNHPEARHFCASIETLDPRVAVPGGKLDLLIAAPECVFHSTARGGKPIDDQRRASAWHILRWLELLRVEEVLIENVPEFVKWGPLGANNRPLKSKAGEIFKAFIAAIESLNYRVEWKVLNAADFGAATTRRRLFVRARRGGKRIAWPAATHSKTGTATLFGGVKKWRAAREVIDWALPSQSIFTRKKPLQPATMRRILEGLRRFGGPELAPFLVQLTHGGRVHSVEEPLKTVTTANRGEIGVAEPFVVRFKGTDESHLNASAKSIEEPIPSPTAGGDGGGFGIAEPFIVPFLGENGQQTPRVRSLDDPLQTVTTQNPIGLVQPFILQPAHGSGGGRGDSGRVHSLDAPLGTQPASNRFGIVEPFVLSQGGGGVPRLVDDPAPTLVAKGAVSLVESFVITPGGADLPNGRSVSEPLPTVTASDRFGVVEPFIVPPRGFDLTDRKVDDVAGPLRTVTAVAGHTFGLVEPLIAKYNSTAKAAKPVSDPLDTISTRDRFALVQPVVNGYTLDIRFRMLQPHELAAAMSFPKSYVFTGNKGDQIRQVGNAVDCRMAQALCGAILDARVSKPTRRSEVA